MKLSEAIRLGAMLKPQAFGCGNDGVGTCAMHAAYHAVGAAGVDTPEKLNALFPIAFTFATKVCCPACGRVEDYGVGCYVGATVVHLNDGHRWTREQIADWVETIEAQQAQPEEVSCAISK